MNVHQILYGLSLSRRVTLSRVQAALGACFLTDAAYAVVITAPQNATLGFLFGAELSLYLIWNVFTMLGVWLGHMIVIPSSAQFSFVGPLTFFVLLIPTLKNRIDLSVVFSSAMAALLCLFMQLGASTILIVGLVSALAGAWMEHHPHPLTRANRP